MTKRQVPLVRRMLLADPRRLLTGACGVGLALMLVLLLDGLWAGVQSQVTAYADGVDANLFVVQRGVRNLTGEGSALPATTLERVRRTPGVAWAARVRSLFVIFELHGKKVPAALVGFVPGERGGPWKLASGRSPEADDEIVVDAALARRHGLRTGSEVTLMGQRLRVVGLSAGTNGFMVGYVFATHAATDALLRAPGTTSYVLVHTSSPAALQRRLRAAGLTVLTRDTVARNDRALLTKIYGAPVRLMVAVAFVAGTLVVALTSYSAIVERRREYGVVRALGADWRRLTLAALGQTMGLALFGMASGAALALGGRWLLGRARPQFPVIFSLGGVGRTVAAAFGMAVVAGLVSARRLATVDPASAYKEG